VSFSSPTEGGQWLGRSHTARQIAPCMWADNRESPASDGSQLNFTAAGPNNFIQLLTLNRQHCEWTQLNLRHLLLIYYLFIYLFITYYIYLRQ